MDPLHFWRITYKFTISNVNIFWINNFFRESIINTICYANSLWIHNLFRKFTLISLCILFLVITMISLSLSRIHYEFTITSANLLWFHNIFADSPSNLRIHSGNISIFAKFLSIHYLIHEFAISIVTSIFFRGIHFNLLFREFTTTSLSLTITFTITINYHFHKFTINS